MEFRKENEDEGIDWRKESGAAQDFDFDSFLDDDLDDRITEILGGRDLLEPEAFGGVSEGYVPRAPQDGEHGRHEAAQPDVPASEPEPIRETAGETAASASESAFDASDPRYAAPERPRVVVAEPRRRVYVTPPSADDERPYRPESRRSGAGLKWAAGILAAIAVAGVVLILRMGRSDGAETAEAGANTPAPTETVRTISPGNLDAVTPAPRETQAPERKSAHLITVTAGTGGTVSPSGAVSVQDGQDAVFRITPRSGYELSQLLIDGASVSLTENYTFSNVKENHTIYAVFTAVVTPTPEPTPTPTPAPTEQPTPTPEPTPEPEPAPAPTEPPQAEEPYYEPPQEPQIDPGYYEEPGYEDLPPTDY